MASHRSPLQATHFSTDTPAPPPQMTENEFMELADATLHDIQSWLDGIEEMLEESDIMFSQGVLKIDLGEHGTWVINRQVPNRQIWWSSPVSGPRRYEYDAESGHWVNTRDKGELSELLRTEILDVTGIEIYT
ncbi:Frataxin conserved site [Phytophthora cactorum]|nr:Frataxin conserved site [Phytophthora cactorum]